MQDEALVDLCRTIYRRHREAIDLIIEYGATSMFSAIAADIVADKGNCEILQSKTRHVWFIPTTWAKVVPENGTAWQHLKRPVSIACWIEQASNRARLIFELSRMDNPALRMACAKALQTAGFTLTSLAFNKDAKYSRFYTSSISVSDWTNEDEMREAVQKLFAKAKEQFPKAETVLRKVFGQHGQA